ncbi:putative exoribonuclease family protein [Thozetella sp. PMI_491]|nr:putative exoribonuclease family protein [Thozetella sp. PMI_491]
MASAQHVLLSPAELAYLHDSLALVPPLRPDGRAPDQFRPLVAETGILPGTNGSARICFADGTEAIVGVKAAVARTRVRHDVPEPTDEDGGAEESEEGGGKARARAGETDWVELMVEIPGLRDDDSTTLFLAQMLSEALLSGGDFVKLLWINDRFHWKLYLDILLISPPLSYPLPLLSLTTHLGLLATRLPRLKSEGDEDPLFDDDWAASTYLYPRKRGQATSRPPITLLVMAVGNNIIFDPAKEELAVADVALAVSVGESPSPSKEAGEAATGAGRSLRLLAIRTIDPPSRLTPPGVPNSANTAYGAPTAQKQPEARTAETDAVDGVWKAPRGGVKRHVMTALVQKVLEKGGVADEVLDGLDAVELG